MVPLFFSCKQLPFAKKQFSKKGPYNTSFQKTMDTVKNVLKNHYEIQEIQEKKGEIQTKWEYTKGYFDFYRTRVTAKVNPHDPEESGETSQKQYMIKLRVEKEEAALSDRTKPVDKENITFESEGRNPEQEKNLLHLIHFDLTEDDLWKKIKMKNKHSEKLKRKYRRALRKKYQQ